MFDTQSILIYLGLAICSFNLAKYAAKNENIRVTWLIIILFSLVAGLRSFEVGIDTKTYDSIFTFASSNDIPSYYNLEIGFKFASTILLNLWDNSSFLFFTFAFISHSLIIITLWKNRHYCSFQWAVLAYYVVYFTFSLNGVRQFIAIAIIIYATNWLREGKYLVFLFMVIVASLFHKTSIVGISYLILEAFFLKNFNKNRKKRVLIIVFLIGMAGYSIISDLLNEYEGYFRVYSASIGLMILVKIMMLFFSIIVIGETQGKTRYIYYSYRWYYFVSLLLSSLSYFFTYVGRIGLYFYVFEALHIGSVFKTRNRTIWIILTKVGYLFIMIYYLYGFFTNGQGEMPYRFFWQN